MNIFNNMLDKNNVVIEATTADSALFTGIRSYVNSTRGRAQLEVECTADIVKAVEDVWGSTPTVTEPTYPAPSAPQPTAEQQQLAAMALAQAQQTATITQVQQTNAALMLKLAGGNK